MRIPKILAAAFVFVLPATANAQPASPSAIVGNAIEDYIKPGYAEFARAAAALEGQTNALCADPSAASLDVTREAFAAAVISWSAIEFVRFGPVRQDNRLERILFFPDRRGIALRQIQGLIASEDETALDPQALNAKSVAVQGLPALEYVLHGSDAETLGSPAADSYRCKLAAAIAGNIGGIADAISAEWQDENGISARLMKPGADNLLYPNTDEALLAILEILPDAYELLIETRLKPFIGDSRTDASPKQAIWWRSGLTSDALAANFDGLRHLMEASGVLEALPSDMAFVQGNIDFEHRSLAATLAALDAPMHEAVTTEEGHARSSFLVVVTQNLRELARSGILGGYGLSAGFSSLDGD